MSTLPATIVYDYFDPRGGGTERYLAEIARWLLRNGHSVRLFARSPNPELPGPLFDTGGPVFRAGWLGEWSFSRSVSRHLGGKRGAVLSAKPVEAVTHYVLTSGIYRRAFEAEREACQPGVQKTFFPVTNRINSKRRWLMRHQERLFAANPHPRFLVFTSALKAELVRDFGAPADDILVSRPGVDLARFHPPAVRPADREAPDFLFIANNFALKGLRNVLLGLEQTHRQGVKAGLQVVGRGPRAPFERLAASLGLRQFVRFHRFLNQDEIRRLLTECTALLHATFYDPCSLVTLEALACGCPVVTTSRNGASETMVSGRHGFVLNDPHDLDSLTSALVALSDPTTLHEIRRNTLELRESLDFENHARTVACWLTGGPADEKN